MRSVFFCIDGHTAGNPVRLVVGGAPLLRGLTMAERRADFQARYDWIRRGLMFEPRGHDMMSGGFLYPPSDAEHDAGVLFIETSGCLGMCGHGTIGIVTFALQAGLIRPRTEGVVRLEVPAGSVRADYDVHDGKVTAIRITNVPSYVHARDVQVDVPDLGRLRVDVAYGGNYYAIVEPQGAYEGIDALGADRIKAISPALRRAVQDVCAPVHPLHPTIRGVSHVLWADRTAAGSTARNAVFYGERAIDRSPCGTGTSARMAQLAARGELSPGDRFIHASIIGTQFIGRVEAASDVAGIPAIVPSIEGSAYETGYNTLWIDSAHPFAEGFTV